MRALSTLISADATLDGITILGGEPLQQATATLALMRAAKSFGLSVMLYTGYEPDELSGDAMSCAEEADLLISGRYVEALRSTTLRWRGSSNQRITSPTGMYDCSTFEELGEAEVHIDEHTGEATVLGYPDDAMLASIGLSRSTSSNAPSTRHLERLLRDHSLSLDLDA